MLIFTTKDPGKGTGLGLSIAYLLFILTGYAITEEISNALNEKLIEKYFSKPYNIPDLEVVILEALNVLITKDTPAIGMSFVLENLFLAFI